MTKVYEALEHARNEKMSSVKLGEEPLLKTPVSKEPEIEMEDEMLSLYQNIDSALPHITRPVILFIGCHSNEGASTIAHQLARTASLRLGKSVLLIALDRSRPQLQVFTDVKPEFELEEVIKTGASVEKAFCRIEDSNLYVMPLFQQTSLNPRTLDSAKDVHFWEQLRARFDLVIVDSPPATLFPDGLAIVRQADGVILVIEAEKTRLPVINAVKERILNHGGNILGVVLNKRKFYIPQWLYDRL